MRASKYTDVHDSVAQQTAAMVSGLHQEPPIVFTGGVSQNADLVERIPSAIGYPIIVPGDASLFAGALGAALLVREQDASDR